MSYYRTIIQVEVLSDSPYGVTNLEDVAYDIDKGVCSGVVKIVSSEEVSKEKMAKLLIAQGSDPEFLLGDD